MARGVGLFCLLTALSMIAPAAMAMDLFVFKHGVPEVSATEILQSIMLAFSCASFAYMAWRHQNARGFFILTAGFLACMFIREQDYYFEFIAYGLWAYPAVAVALGCLGYAFTRARDTLWMPAADTILHLPRHRPCHRPLFQPHFRQRKILVPHHRRPECPLPSQIGHPRRIGAFRLHIHSLWLRTRITTPP